MRVILHTDGGVRTGGVSGPTKGKTGRGAAAFVIHDDAGELLRRGGVVLEGDVTVNETEYSAFILGLYNARALGATEVTLCSDSQLVTNQVTGKYACKQPHLKEYLEEVRAEIESFDRADVKWIPREENTMADEETRRLLDDY